MPIIVRAFPLRRPVAALYRKYGVTHESWHVQETPAGPWVIAVTKAADPSEAAPRYAASSASFDSWFKSEVLRLSGVDPDTQPLGPPTTEIFAWSDSNVTGSNLCA
jgi:hypothetical protein